MQDITLDGADQDHADRLGPCGGKAVAATAPWRPFIARPASRSSGTKYSSSSNSFPTASMAGIIVSAINIAGFTPAASASCTAASAFFASPARIASSSLGQHPGLPPMIGLPLPGERVAH